MLQRFSLRRGLAFEVGSSMASHIVASSRAQPLYSATSGLDEAVQLSCQPTASLRIATVVAPNPALRSGNHVQQQRLCDPVLTADSAGNGLALFEDLSVASSSALSEPESPLTTSSASSEDAAGCPVPGLPKSESWFGQRKWSRVQHTKAEDMGPSPPVFRFSVMCYNILADTYAHFFASKLYRDVPRRCLDWPARRALLLAEIRHWAPDVVCLQEVQHFADLEPEMKAAGYEGRFVRRTGRRRDGCATFWRSDRLRACSLSKVEYAPLGLEDNVAMITSLQPRCEDGSQAEALANVRLLVATTHITFDPAKGDVKLGQVRTLLNRTAGLATCPSLEEEEPPQPPTTQPLPSPWPHPNAHSHTDSRRRRAPSPLRGSAPAPAAGGAAASGGAHGIDQAASAVPLAQAQGGCDAGGASRGGSEGAAGPGGAARRPARGRLQSLAIVTGDFNSTAGSPLYQFVARGSLDLAVTSRKKLSGQLHGVCHTQYKPITEVKQLHAQLTASNASTASMDCSLPQPPLPAPSSTPTVTAVATSAPSTPRAPNDATSSTAPPEPPTAAATAAAAAASIAAAAEAAAAAGSRALEAFLSQQRERWSERELRHAMGETQYAQYVQRFPATAAAAGRPQRRSAGGAELFPASAPLSVAEPSQTSTSASGAGPAAAAARGSSSPGRTGLGRQHAVPSASLASRISMSDPAALPGAGAGGQQGAAIEPRAAGGGSAGSGSSGGSLVVRHPLPLRSSYMDVARAEPSYTSIHSGFLGTVDFIWYTREATRAAAQAAAVPDGSAACAGLASDASLASYATLASCGSQSSFASLASGDWNWDPVAKEATTQAAAGGEEGAEEGEGPAYQLLPVAVLQPPDLETLPRGLPAVGWGSDHISLLTQFELRQV